MRKFIALVAAALLAGSGQAATVAGSTFSAGDEGWRVGEFTSLSGNAGVSYNAGLNLIETEDVLGWTAFVAPAAYLGDQSRAFGGTLSFDLSDAENDFPTVYRAVALHGAGLVLYSLPTVVPGTATLTNYNFALVGANFTIGSAWATDAELRAVLADLDRIAIDADWKSGNDFARLDNVLFCDSTGCDIQPLVGTVPEPGVWLTMLAGFGLLGGAMRRHNRRTSARA